MCELNTCVVFVKGKKINRKMVYLGYSVSISNEME